MNLGDKNEVFSQSAPEGADISISCHERGN